MSGGMGQLVGAGDIAGGKDIGVEGFEIGVGFDNAPRGDAEGFKSIAFEPRGPSGGHDQRIEREDDLISPVLDDQRLLVVGHGAKQRAVPCQHADTIRLQTLQRGSGNLNILAKQQAVRHFDLRHLSAQPREALREFAADRAAAQQHDAAGDFIERGKGIPERVAGEIADFIQPRQRRHEGARTRSDHDGSRRQALRLARWFR